MVAPTIVIIKTARQENQCGQHQKGVGRIDFLL
jgi:hypothetical protein